MEISRDIDGKMNSKKWNSDDKDSRSENQHTPHKKWYVTTAPKRVKQKWNKKRGRLELTKKGSKEYYLWAD